MVTYGTYTCEHSRRYRVVELLCSTPKTNATLCVTYTSVKINIFLAQQNSATAMLNSRYILWINIQIKQVNSFWNKRKFCLEVNIFHQRKQKRCEAFNNRYLVCLDYKFSVTFSVIFLQIIGFKDFLKRVRLHFMSYLLLGKIILVIPINIFNFL